MNSATQNEKTDIRRIVEASGWRAHFAETGLTSCPEFESWLVEDERNHRAWDRVQASWDFFTEQATAPEILNLRHRALERARSKSRERWSGSRWARAWKPAVAAGVVALALAATLSWYLFDAGVYRTNPGERRLVTLADGSRIQLDSSTELRVNYSESARELTLVKGQARFDVARDVERPFSVLAANRKVVALGTAFNVDLLGEDLVVTLIEGRVAILPKNNESERPAQLNDATATATIRPNPKKKLAKAAEPVELTVGQQLTVSATGQAQVKPANMRRTIAWQSGELIFDDEPLSSVVKRVNRYAPRPLSLADEQTATLRISGVFDAGDIEGFITTVTHYLPVEARETHDSIVLTRR